MHPLSSRSTECCMQTRTARRDRWVPGALQHCRKVSASHLSLLHATTVHKPSSAAQSHPCPPWPICCREAASEFSGPTQHPAQTAHKTEALSPAPAPPSLSALQLPALEQQPGAALSHSMLSASHAAIHRFLVYFSFSERHAWFKPTTSEIESNMAITDHPHRLWGHHREHRWDAGEGAGGLAPPGGSHQLQILIGLHCAGG